MDTKAPKKLWRKIASGLGIFLAVAFLFLESPTGRSLFDQRRDRQYQSNINAKEYTNDLYGYSLAYDPTEFKLTTVGDIVFVRGDNPDAVFR